MREVATLACPIGKLKTDQYDDVTEMGSEETWAGTNKKPRIFTDEDKNQSRTWRPIQILEGRHTIDKIDDITGWDKTPVVKIFLVLI